MCVPLIIKGYGMQKVQDLIFSSTKQTTTKNLHKTIIEVISGYKINGLHFSFLDVIIILLYFHLKQHVVKGADEDIIVPCKLTLIVQVQKEFQILYGLYTSVP